MESIAFISQEYNNGFYHSTFRHSLPLHQTLRESNVHEFNSIISLATQAIAELRRSAHNSLYASRISYIYQPLSAGLIKKIYTILI